MIHNALEKKAKAAVLLRWGGYNRVGCEDILNYLPPSILVLDALSRETSLLK